jgi:hypothetical protein
MCKVLKETIINILSASAEDTTTIETIRGCDYYVTKQLIWEEEHKDIADSIISVLKRDYKHSILIP